MIEVRNISKKYKKVQALSDVSLSIQEGMVTGIVGPNGSGKSTFIKIVTGLITHFEGEVHFDRITQQQLSLASEEFGFPSYYSVKKVVKVFSLLKNAEETQTNELIDYLKLSPHLSKTVKQLSQGLKQRLNIACALMGNSEIIILDEPNNGLDPDGFKQLREIILKSKKEGKTVIVASHLLNEIEKTCDQVIFLNNGKKLAQESTKIILEEHGSLEAAYDHYSNL